MRPEYSIKVHPVQSKTPDPAKTASPADAWEINTMDSEGREDYGSIR